MDTSKNVYFGGVEGGATNSKLIICNENGEIIALVKGCGTNHWMTGIKECAKRISDMLTEAKVIAKLPPTTQLKSFGLSLSGCEQEATNIELEKELKTIEPQLSEHYVVCSDTVGSIATASKIGGFVIISGTGSNALLRNSDGTTYGCGGWGNVLGDEGSAWWISHRAMKTVFDDEDNFVKSKYPTTTVWNLIKIHFSVETRSDLLDHCYAKFCKPFFAGLCLKLSNAAIEGDQLCQELFKDAGHQLARTIIALMPKINHDLIKTGELSVVCVGSVWDSWNLLKDGFINELNKTEIKYIINLIRLKQTMALGSVYLASDSIKYDLPRDYNKNYEIFHSYNQKIQHLNGVK